MQRYVLGHTAGFHSVILIHVLLKYRAGSSKKGGTDSKFFTTNRKGENHELREELRSPQRDRKRDAVKKVCFIPAP
jgi:hypothetical protein